MSSALKRLVLGGLIAGLGAVGLFAQQPVTTVSGSTTAVTQTTSPWIVAGGGTAGTAATGVVTIQGIAGMTKVQVTPDSVALPANQSVNVAQVNGATSAGVAQLGVWTFSAKTTLTTTNFTSLANGSGWQSVAITTSGIRDVILRVQTKGQTSGSNYVDFYVCTTISSDTTYVDGCTGSEGTFTAANRLNGRYLCSIKANITTAVQGMCSLSDVYAVLPGKFAFIAINNTGAAMSVTGGDHVFDYETVK